MKTYLKQAVIAMTLSIALVAPSSPSFAGGYHQAIDYTDLNLDQPGDVAVLYTRIQDAARVVCREDRASWDGSLITHYKTCIRETVDKAVSEVNHYALTAMHQGRSESVAKR